MPLRQIASRTRIGSVATVAGLTAVLLGGSAVAASAATAQAAGAAAAARAKTKVTVDIEPNTDSAALELGAEKGLFARYGLSVSVDVIPSGATALANVVSGDVQFAATTYGGLFAASVKGLPLLSIGPGSAGPAAHGKDQNQILALKSSGITSAKGLDGKKVGVVQLQSVNQAEVQEAVSAAGGNPGSVTFVPLQFPQMGSALQHGQVNAIAVSEPFVTQTDSQMQTVDLGGLDLEVGPNTPLLTVAVSKSYYAAHKTTVREFQEGMLASAKYADAHMSAVRAVLPKVAGITAALSKKVLLPYYPTTVNMTAVNKINRIMVQFKDMPKSANVKSLLVTFPPKS